VMQLTGPNGVSVVLVGGVHTSRSAAEDVQAVLEASAPDAVVIEMCMLRARGVPRCVRACSAMA
jgi:pheromone shutdown protein TraB